MVNKPSIVEILEAGLNTSAKRGSVTANNIANLDTPGFRRQEVLFEKILADAIDSSSGVSRKELQKMEPELNEPGNTPVKGNGNDVDLHIEVGGMIRNTVRQKAYLRILGKMYKQMELAIEGR